MTKCLKGNVWIPNNKTTEKEIENENIGKSKDYENINHNWREQSDRVH